MPESKLWRKVCDLLKQQDDEDLTISELAYELRMSGLDISRDEMMDFLWNFIAEGRLDVDSQFHVWRKGHKRPAHQKC